MIAILLPGDVDGDGARDLRDVIAHVRFIFDDGSEPGNVDAADANGDGHLDPRDAVFTLETLFGGGMP